MKKYIILFSALLFSGCATLGTPELHESVAKRLIRSSGTAENVSTNFFTGEMNIVVNKKSFSLEDPRVTWWGQVRDNSVLPLKLHAKWIDPQGNLYKEYDFFAMNNPSGVISTALPIKNYIFSEQQGAWKITISFHGNEVDTREFYIAGMGEKTGQEISEEELKKIFPDLDKANALILLHEVKVEVDRNYKTKRVVKRRIKILSDRGKEMYSIINTPFYSTLETVDVNMAHTIKPDGQIVEAKEIQAFSPFEDYPKYKASQILSIAMPSVEKGSIIEYEIETTSLMPQILPSFWSDFYFNRIDPTLDSRYIVVCPEDFDLKISEFNVSCEPKISIDSAKKTKTYIWEKGNWQTVEFEKFIPSQREVLSNINVYTSSSWQNVAAWWNDLSKNQISTNSEILNKAQELIKECHSKLEKTKAIFSFVQSEIRYVQVEFGASPYQPAPAIETFKNRYGDCKDQTTLLIAMLKAADIDDAYYGIVRTRNEGPINEMAANPREFNHVIAVVKVDGKEMYLDPTAKKLKFSLIPFPIEGTQVFMINGDYGHFINVPFSEADINQINSLVTLNIANDLGIEGKLKTEYKGQVEWFIRSYLERLEPKQRDEYAHSILASIYPGAALKDYSIKYESELDKNLEIEISCSLPNWIEKVGEVYLLKFTDDKIASPPEYLSIKRKFPVKGDYKSMTRIKIAIILPDNLAIKELPPDFSVDSDYLSSSVKYEKGDNKIIREQMIKSLVVDISAEEVTKYKETYDEIFKAHKQGIVLSDNR